MCTVQVTFRSVKCPRQCVSELTAVNDRISVENEYICSTNRSCNCITNATKHHIYDACASACMKSFDFDSENLSRKHRNNI